MAYKKPIILNKHYSSLPTKNKSTQEERDNLLKNFLNKGCKIEKIKPQKSHKI